MIQHVKLGKERKPGQTAAMRNFSQPEVTSKEAAPQLASTISKLGVKPSRPVPQNRESLVYGLGRRRLKYAAI